MANKMRGGNPWREIWTKPRATIRSIVDSNPKQGFYILSFLYGLPALFNFFQNVSLGKDYPLWGILLMGIVLATFLGMLGITIASGLIYWTGKWIGGKSNFINIRAAVSWSNVPNIGIIFVWACLIVLYREGIFIENVQYNILPFALFIEAILSIWSFIILIKGVGEVQGFSAWKGFFNVLIPFFLVGILMWLITAAVWFFYGMGK